MPSDILDVVDGARYVEKIGVTQFAVWHGGHTVNFYSTEGITAHPTTSISVGDFETGEVTLEDVKEGIEAETEVR